MHVTRAALLENVAGACLVVARIISRGGAGGSLALGALAGGGRRALEMKVIAGYFRLILAFCAAGCAAPGASSPPAPWMVYRGASDASAAAALSGDRVLVADDESNALRVYMTGGGLPLVTY